MQLFHQLQNLLSVKRIPILLTAYILVLGYVQANTIFVSQGGAGNGASWTAPLGNLHQALETAKPGDQVWVSKGTYRTSERNDRAKSFVLSAGVELYGGFADFETAIEQRNLQANVTYLSGEIGTASLHDNAFTVVYFRNAGENTILDGFCITGGAADGSDKANHLEFRGAGILNMAADGQSSSPMLRNCTITGNYAREGGGMLNIAINKGVCRPVIWKCSFINNKADLDGGAMMNATINGDCSPEIRECHFESNQASYGGGIFNEPKGGSVNPVIRDNEFIDNKALVRNGSIHCEYFGNGECKPDIGGNIFKGNSSPVGTEKD